MRADPLSPASPRSPGRQDPAHQRRRLGLFRAVVQRDEGLLGVQVQPVQFAVMGEVSVNFVAFDETQDCCLMVLVEEGWTGPIDANLRALQDRLYGCIDAALSGQL